MDELNQCLTNILYDLQSKYSNFIDLEFRDGKKVDPSLLKRFIQANGFRTLKIYNTTRVIKLTQNIVEVYTPQEVFNYSLKFIESHYSDFESVFIEQGEKYLISKKALLGSLKPIEFKPFKDDILTSRHFFNNCFVEVTSNEIKRKSYEDLQRHKKYIFKDAIIDRPFQVRPKEELSDFEKFLKLSTNSDEHFESVCSSIGYLLHSFKNPANAKAIILSDVLSQATNEANGRSGKGLIIKAIAEFINVVEYNGKNLDLKRDKFVYQSIDYNTDLFVIQDVSKSFDFEDLFSQITDKMDVQKKHVNKMIIDFASSPKIAITTNYTIPQNTDSYADRKQLILLNNYFNANHKPESEFKKLFFVEWDEKQFLAFDNFVMRCIQSFLKNGLINYDDPELQKQNLINNTSKVFIDLIESQYFINEYYLLKELAAKLEINSNEDSVKSKITMQWLNTYAKYNNFQIETRRSGGIVKFCFLNKS